MDTHPHYTIVGLGMVILFTALIFWASWLWRGDAKERTDFYAIYFRKQSLSGLQIDSIVTMRGIRIGSVKSIAIQPQDIERVKVTIAINFETPVRTDTRAVISRNLLTGLAGIDLIGSTQASEPLKLAAKGESLAVIEEGQTGLDQVQQSVPELLAKSSLTLEKLGLLLSDKNIESFNRTLQNIEQGSAAFAQVGNVINSADKTLLTLSDVLKETKGKVSPALDEFAATMKEIKSETASLSAAIAALIRTVSATSDRLKDPRASVLGLASGQLGPGEGKGE